MDERLLKSGIKKVKNEDGVMVDELSIVEIPSSKPVKAFKAFPHPTGKPLILIPSIMDAKLGGEYSAPEKLFEKEKVLSNTKWIPRFNDFDDITDSYSSVRFVEVEIWGKCFKIEKFIYAQYCRLLKIIKVDKIKLAPMTASYLLLNRTDLSKEEIINCRNRIRLQEYGLYTHMLQSKEFDLEFFRYIDDEKIAMCVSEGIKGELIGIKEPEKLLETINQIQEETKEDQKETNKWAYLCLLKKTVKKIITEGFKKEEEKIKEKGPISVIKDPKEEGKNV